MSNGTQKQKAGDGSKQYQSGGDMHVYEAGANAEKEDRELVVDILDHIFEQYAEPVAEPAGVDHEKIRDLKNKISLNFSSSGVTDAEKLFNQTWLRKNEIEKLLQDRDPESVQGFIVDVQSTYREIKESDTCNTAVENANVFLSLSKKYVPSKYAGNDKAELFCITIILLLFELCELGKVTDGERENMTQLSFFNS